MSSDPITVLVNNEMKDEFREEEMWNEHSEALLQSWSANCQTAMRQHGMQAKLCRSKDALLSIPTIVISIVMTGVTGLLHGTPSGQYVNTFGFVVTGILTGVNTFFRYGNREQIHGQFGNLYAGVAEDINIELLKARQFRTPSDVFIARTTMRIRDLDAQAPPL